MKYTRYLAQNLMYLLCLLSIDGQITGQVPAAISSADIYENIERLRTTGKVLYIAAHPDDENTRLISYFSNILDLETTYLSLTRGDGGQNMIGTHIQEDLGIIRTQELLAARRIDNGRQMFTRANDFGYSKTAEESLKIWDKEKVLGDVVWAIRKTQPDIIITRFDENDMKTHGHHRASAILALEAFELANDHSAYPEQLKYVTPWQPKKLFYNTSWWRYGSQEAFDTIDKSNMVTVDIGAFNPLSGESMAEVAARSRSQHKSQGFGSSGSRGSDLEYLILKKDIINGYDAEKAEFTLPKDYTLFSGIDLTWNRYEIGEVLKFDIRIEQLLRTFNVKAPEESIDDLILLHGTTVGILRDDNLRNSIQQEIEQLLIQCAGIYCGAFVDQQFYTPGENIIVEFEYTARSTDRTKLQNIQTELHYVPIPINRTINENIKIDTTIAFKVNKTNISNPYWLDQPGTVGMYHVAEQQLVGRAENDPPYSATFNIAINNKIQIPVTVPIRYRTTDRVRGEVRNPITIVPHTVVLPTQDVLLFKNGEEQLVSFILKSFLEQVDTVEFALTLPEGWKADSSRRTVIFQEKGDENELEFRITPPIEASKGKITFHTISEVINVDSLAIVEQKNPLHMLTTINYDHIPLQVKSEVAEIQCINLKVETRGKKVGYIMGAGDKVPQAIAHLGYDVVMLEHADIIGNLEQYDAIVTGIRAYNTVERMPIYQPLLLEYVKQGGTLIVQYNTTWGLEMNNIGPYPIEFSRERVTEEDALITFLNPKHPVVQSPNLISQKDFDGWVQERGLYFARDWDKNYTPIFSAHDEGESARKGGMLIANYGEGYFIYTGYSWFRELPAGVPGAYRIFANMLSLGNE